MVIHLIFLTHMARVTKITLGEKVRKEFTNNWRTELHYIIKEANSSGTRFASYNSQQVKTI